MTKEKERQAERHKKRVEELLIKKEWWKEWMKDAWPVYPIDSDYDDSGNHWTEDVFKKDNKFYKVAFCNGVVCSDTPIEVVSTTRMIEITEWNEV